MTGCGNEENGPAVLVSSDLGVSAVSLFDGEAKDLGTTTLSRNFHVGLHYMYSQWQFACVSQRSTTQRVQCPFNLPSVSIRSESAQRQTTDFESFINSDIREILNFENELHFEPSLSSFASSFFQSTFAFRFSGRTRERKREHLLANAVNLGKKPVSVSEREDT